MPWAGVLAAAGWVLGNATPSTERAGDPEALERLVDGGTQLFIAQEGYALMVLGLLVLSVAVRSRLRAGEGGESTYSGLAHAGLLAGAGAVMARLALTQVAAAAGDEADRAVAHLWSYLDFYAWWPILLSVSTAMASCGIGGIRTSQFPRWYSRTSLVLGLLGILGAFNVPPGGLIVYLLLPLWLVATTIVLRRQAGAAVVA
jgi:hypothetical protein